MRTVLGCFVWLFEFTGELKFVRDGDWEEEKEDRYRVVWRVG